jgi:hypothetical protein
VLRNTGRPGRATKPTGLPRGISRVPDRGTCAQHHGIVLGQVAWWVAVICGRCACGSAGSSCRVLRPDAAGHGACRAPPMAAAAAAHGAVEQDEPPELVDFDSSDGEEGCLACEHKKQKHF